MQLIQRMANRPIAREAVQNTQNWSGRTETAMRTEWAESWIMLLQHPLVIGVIDSYRSVMRVLCLFTALHVMQTRSCDENSVCLSVRLSANACIVTKQKKSQSRFLYHGKNHLVWFSEKNGWWGSTASTGNFGSTGPRWSEIADFEPIIARSASAVRPIEKKFN